MCLLVAKLHLPALLRTALGVAAAISGVVGFVMAKWAQFEHNFLTRPDSEGPAETFSDRP